MEQRKHVDSYDINIDPKIEVAIDKLQNIAEELKDRFVERDRVIDNSIKALITGQMVLLIGPPGTAKSALTHELCSRIENGRYFSWLLNRTSDPSEILGPYSIKEMENDKFLRVTTSKLPEAEIAFLDEIFKCNEPTLNILLSIINEKVFYNDGQATQVPLVSLFAASNEFPEEDSLMALYDRMIFRMYVDYIRDTNNKMKMFKSFLEENQKHRKATTISIDELELLRTSLNEVIIEDSVLKEYISLMNELFQNGIIVSDRRQNECLKVLRVNALLDKRDRVDAADFLALRDVLWSDLEDIPKIEELLKERAVSPYKKEYGLLKKQFNQLIETTKSLKDIRMIVEIKESIEHLYNKTNRMLREAEFMEDDIRIKFTATRKEIKEHLDRLEKQIKDEGLMDDLF